MKFVDDTPTKGRFRKRERNEIYFTGSDRINERPGLYAFWTAFCHDPKPWMKKTHPYTRIPARARATLPKGERFERMRTDAITKPKNRSHYRQHYRMLKKPLQVRRSDTGEIAWWVKSHPELIPFLKFMPYRKHGVMNPWR
jgi:hypothetical protein